jgi:hypothetical protein
LVDDSYIGQTGLGEGDHLDLKCWRGHGAALEALAVDVLDDPNNGDPVVIFTAGIESFDVFCAGALIYSGLYISI